MCGCSGGAACRTQQPGCSIPSGVQYPPRGTQEHHQQGCGNEQIWRAGIDIIGSIGRKLEIRDEFPGHFTNAALAVR